MATFDYHALTYKGCHPPLYAGDPCRDIAGEPIGSHAEAMYFVYLMASQKNGTLYCGVTNDLMRRAYEHREGLVEDFTESHGVKRLVWFEPHDSVEHAIRREKRIKNYPRQWKINLIEAENPDWADLWKRLSF